ncbi:hypothetical protein CEXT_745081 [Caerostris extrusa]|uniref:Uncharacterized protein n=1 Tax=Caerostris extrusa TaxID=172846 RepID=A0AAV4WV59_CAEEX|nr:hypothetical protein CEXT_745081 [Caerostris extrusa]
MSFFLVGAPKSKKSIELLNIDFSYRFKVKAEKLRRRLGPAQCFNCLQFFHHSSPVHVTQCAEMRMRPKSSEYPKPPGGQLASGRSFGIPGFHFVSWR